MHREILNQKYDAFNFIFITLPVSFFAEDKNSVDLNRFLSLESVRRMKVLGWASWELLTTQMAKLNLTTVPFRFKT